MGANMECDMAVDMAYDVARALICPFYSDNNFGPIFFGPNSYFSWSKQPTKLCNITFHSI